MLLVLRPEGTDSSPDDELSDGDSDTTRRERARWLSNRTRTASTTSRCWRQLPTPGTITDEAQIESVDAVQWTLSNGITIIAKQTDFRNDEVLFSAHSPGGHSLVADADHVSALYAAALVAGSGAGLHDSVTLDKLLAGKRVSVSPYIRELFEGLSGSASPEDLESLFQLITLYVTAPRPRPGLLLDVRGKASQYRRGSRHPARRSSLRHCEYPPQSESLPLPAPHPRAAGGTQTSSGRKRCTPTALPTWATQPSFSWAPSTGKTCAR